MTSFTYAGQIGPFVAQDSAGNVQPAAVVTLRDATNTTDAVAYVDRDRSDEMDNPLTLTADGVLTCWAEPGEYVLRTVVGEETRTQTVTVYASPTERPVVDPNVYRSFTDVAADATLPGMLFENNTGDLSSTLILWDTVYAINATSAGSGVAYEDSAFAWDPSVVGDPDRPGRIEVKQPGLYAISYQVDFSTLVLEGGETTYRVDLSSNPPLQAVFPGTGKRAVITSMVWLQESTTVARKTRLSLVGVDEAASTVSYAGLYLAPMFVLDGVTPTDDLP